MRTLTIRLVNPLRHNRIRKNNFCHGDDIIVGDYLLTSCTIFPPKCNKYTLEGCFSVWQSGWGIVTWLNLSVPGVVHSFLRPFLDHRSNWLLKLEENKGCVYLPDHNLILLSFGFSPQGQWVSLFFCQCRIVQSAMNVQSINSTLAFNPIYLLFTQHLKVIIFIWELNQKGLLYSQI